MFSDTEAETSDQVYAMPTEQEPNLMVKSNGTIFNITLSDTPVDTGNDKKYADYEARLTHEVMEWQSYLNTASKKWKQIKEERQSIDCSILPAEKLAYLQSGPCLQKFIRESVQFRQETHLYLEKDVEEARETQENLSAICDQYIDLLRNKALIENMANVPSAPKE